MKRKRGPTPKKAWETLTERAGLEGGNGLFEKYGATPPDEVWGNDLFSVTVRYGDAGAREDVMLWLSIHRRDRKAIHDWRHLQAVKNDVAGPERIGLEVYPAESNLVDTANEYHLWVLPVGAKLGFGFEDGPLVMTPEEVDAKNFEDEDAIPGGGSAVQREWEPSIPTGAGARS